MHRSLYFLPIFDSCSLSIICFITNKQGCYSVQLEFGLAGVGVGWGVGLALFYKNCLFIFCCILSEFQCSTMPGNWSKSLCAVGGWCGGLVFKHILVRSLAKAEQ